MINKNEKKILILNNNVVNEDIPEKTDFSSNREVVLEVCRAIREGGYNPVSQLAGYLLSEDPTHIANYKHARSLMTHIDRDELIEDIVRSYLELIESEASKAEDEND